jgi:signal transduction histidine kinase/ligand-binding sensor domain-containing protein/CheY-like chemotaxis protein/AraC-like DNA-binding protein
MITKDNWQSFKQDIISSYSLMMSRKNLTKNILCWLIVLMGIINANGQQLSFNRLNSEDGLSNNLVTSIIQDSKGFLWFGTQDGLNRYDGYNIKVFKNSEEDTCSVLDNLIFSLYVDSKGELWVGSLNGMSKFNYETETFKRYPVSTSEIQGFKKEPLGSIAEDMDGNMWYGNRNGGLYMFKPGAREFTYFDYPSKNVSKLFVDENNNLFAGTIDCEIYYFDKKNNRFIKSELPNYSSPLIPENYVRNMYKSIHGKLVINTSHGILQVDPFSGTSKSLSLLPKGFSGFRNNEIRYVFEESANIIWIGTWGKGLYCYNAKEDKVANYQVEPGNTNSLGNNDVNVIFKDASGVIWVGTQDGVTKIDAAKDIFKKYQYNPKEPESLHFNFITSFCEDNNGNIWIGTYGGGISIFDPVTESFKKVVHLPGNKNSIANDAIRAICIDPSGKIWIGTMKGIDVFDPKTKKFTHYENIPDNSNSLSNNDILCIINGGENDLWVGSFGGGVTRVILPNHFSTEPKFINHNTKGDLAGISSKYIRSLMYDDSGYLWIGNLGSGLDRMDLKTGRITHYSKEGNENFSLRDNNINSIRKSSDGSIWIGTWDGISRLSPDNGEISNFSLKEGLPDKNVADIQQDNYGSIWAATFKGIIKLNTDNSNNFRLISFNTQNGLQSNKFNINASLKSKNGNLYFGGTTGFNIIVPERIVINNFIPPVVLTSLSVFNEEVKINEKVNGRVILNKALNESEKITLTFREKIFSIEFAALSYSENERNCYQYYLEGVDKQWVNVNSKRRFATYSNLKTGNYTFKVRASNSDGIWNDEGISFKIEMLPPPWRSWWSYIIYSAVIMLVLLLARNYSLSQARLRHNLQIQRLEKEKSDEVNQLKLKFFTNVSHEFRTPLTLILAPVQKILNDKSIEGDMRESLELVNNNSKRLLNLVNQLMDFRKLDTANLSVTVCEENIFALLNTIKSAFDLFAKEHNITYRFISEIKEETVWCNREMIEKIFFNLLSNSFKFTKNGGSISVIQRKASDYGLGDKGISNINYIVIEVKDSGIGIPHDRINKIFERFYQVDREFKNSSFIQSGSGIGLALTKELVELHSGKIKVESIEGKGTKFSVYLPLGKEYAEKLNYTIVDKTTEQTEFAKTDNFIEPLAIEEEEIIEQLTAFEEDENDESRRLHILIVEDNHDLRRFLRICLKEKYHVTEASNGVRAYSMAVHKLPDLIISDIMMPVMDGIEFCKKIKSDLRTSHIPVILLTAYNSDEKNIKGFESGADSFIAKPFNTDILLARISNLIECRQKLALKYYDIIKISDPSGPDETMDKKFIHKAIKIVEENLPNPDFNVEMLSKELGMSRTNLFRKIKALTNYNAVEFIRAIKMKKAAQLLLKGYNVSETMNAVGISSRSYFIKTFTIFHKESPSEFIYSHQTSLN